MIKNEDYFFAEEALLDFLRVQTGLQPQSTYTSAPKGKRSPRRAALVAGKSVQVLVIAFYLKASSVTIQITTFITISHSTHCDIIPIHLEQNQLAGRGGSGAICVKGD